MSESFTVIHARLLAEKSFSANNILAYQEGKLRIAVTLKLKCLRLNVLFEN